MRGFLCLLGLLGSANALVFRGSNEMMMVTDMQPELAAKLLSGVENRWTREAQSLLSGQSAKLERDVTSDVVKSCTKIANSIVTGSDGESEKVQEYMESVCAATTNKRDNELCLKFQDGVQHFMTYDTEFDREELDMSKFCEKFYESTIRKVAEERKVEDEKEAKAEEARKVEEKKQEEKAKEVNAIKKAKESEKTAQGAEKVADELTAANEKEQLAEDKLMEAQNKEANSLKLKARKELERAAALDAAEKATAKAEAAFTKAAEEEKRKKKIVVEKENYVAAKPLEKKK